MKVSGSTLTYWKNRLADPRPVWTVNGVRLLLVPRYAIIDESKHVGNKQVTIYAESQKIVRVTIGDDNIVTETKLRDWIDRGGKFSEALSSGLMVDDFPSMRHYEDRLWKLGDLE